MKKNFIAMMTVVLLCALTTACGGSSSTSSNNSDIPSDGVLGENGREIYDLMNEFMITIDQQKEELQSHYTFNENHSIGFRYNFTLRPNRLQTPWSSSDITSRSV